jgi:polyhydroxybutyrate depolymerase
VIYRLLRVTGVTLSVLAVAIFAAWAYWVHTPPIEPVPSLSGELVEGTIRVGELDRHYLLYRPKHRRSSPPLLFALHGSMGNGRQAQVATFYEFERLADRQGFLVVYPDGFDRYWNDCRAAGPYRANTEDVDDVAFFREMVDHFVATEGVDPDRVYAAGFSNGGQMAYRLALEAPDLMAGVAAVAASLPDDANFDCEKSGRPVAVMVINGTADPVNPFDGGPVALWGLFGNRGTVLSTQETIDYFAQLAGHREPPIVTPFPDAAKHDSSRADLRVWSDGPGPHVALIAVHGGGHTFPFPRDRYPRFLGPTNADLDAAAEIWRFFSEARR